MNYYDLLRYFATANSATKLGHGDRTDVEQLFTIPLGYLTTILITKMPYAKMCYFYSGMSIIKQAHTDGFMVQSTERRWY